MLENINFAADVDSIIALIMAVIFATGLGTMLLPSANSNGLKPYLAAMLITAVLLFLASSAWLWVDNVLESQWTVWVIWIRTGCRIANFLATRVFVYRVVRYESPI